VGRVVPEHVGRPHITVNGAGGITQVTWAPPFEGPLPTTHGAEATAYYQAYASFARLIAREVARGAQATVAFEPGDVITFNNRRMLHGRAAFSAPPTGTPLRRRLRGCYVNIDEFKSKHEALRQLVGGESPHHPHPPVANQDLTPETGAREVAGRAAIV
jgi:gamma-butyrobetaine dioxygenase